MGFENIAMPEELTNILNTQKLPKKSVIIYDEGRADGKARVLVTINGDQKEIIADQMKLARTMFNKPGEKYTKEEMWEMGFKLK